MPFINGIGAPELIIILIIALIVVGPGRLPDVGAALGKSIREFRKAATDVKDATSLEEKPQSAPAPAAVAPAVVPTPAPAIPAASTAVPAAAPVAEPVAAAAPAPDISEMPEPQPVADEQPTPTA
ncbi:MAG TPA: twin-arginine translocase TatA/TatE family subunit [Candidatus Limnocylindrales bacterium]|nr:twin-arginine translocase TatA/TatE family subunit [Candidatus Limnocylindrales bacterium]